MKVLIVDDSEPMRRMIKTFVADLVQDVIERSDGSEALAAYREHRPDMVLMDLKLKTMDGLAATRQIKAFVPGRTDRHRVAVGRCRAARTGALRGR